MVKLKKNFIIVILTIVTAIVVSTFIYNYGSLMNEYTSTYQNNINAIENTLSKTADFLEINGKYANQTLNNPYLNETFKNYENAYLLDYLEYDEEKDIYHLDKLSTLDIDSSKFNSIIGRGNLDFLEDENNLKTKELYFSMLMNNNFNTLSEKLPSIYRITYISLNASLTARGQDNFLTVDALSHASGILHKPFIQMGTKENLSDRTTVYWTNPYIDPNTSELLITASYPVDYKGNYIGVISTDFTTGALNKVFDDSFYCTIILTKDGSVITENSNTTNFDTKLINFDDLPLSIKYDDVKDLSLGEIHTINGSKVVAHSIKNTPYTLYQVYAFKDLATDVFVTLLPLLLFILLFILININYYKMREAKKVQEELLYVANFDALTNVYNRRGFNKEVETLNTPEAINNSSLVLLDIDHFKKINDTFGHDIGDEVLSELCQVINSCAVEDEVVARFGGEEFVVLLKGQPLEKAIDLAEKIRIAVESNDFKVVGRVTVSVGVSGLHSGEDVTESLKNADLALYKAKETSRNAVYYYNNEEIKAYTQYAESKTI